MPVASPLSAAQELKAADVALRVLVAQQAVVGPRFRQAHRGDTTELAALNVSGTDNGALSWECHEYLGPIGRGYELWVTITKTGRVYRRGWHNGPETHRDAISGWEDVTP